MTARGKTILLGVFFIGLSSICSQTFAIKVEPYSSEASTKKNNHVNTPAIASTFARFEENAPTLIKLMQAICEVFFAALWTLDTSLNAFLWLLNETISSCTDVCIRVFGILFNVVKLLEAFGFGIKFLLELNYAVLSYIFDTFGCIKVGLADAVTLVKITLANQTQHVYDSSSMALEGVQNLFLTACNQTWVNLQYVSSIVTTSFKPPFGLSALDLSLLVSMCLSGVEFFVESVKMTSGMLKDGNLFLLSYMYGTFCNSGKKVLEYILAFVYCIRDGVTMVITQTVYMVTLPFYILSGIVSNIWHMLCHSWEAFVNWVGYIDSLIREMVFSVLRTIGLGLSVLINGISGNCYKIVDGITRCLSGIVYIVIGAISSIAGFINLYIPGGFLGCIVLVCVSVVLYLWHKEITSLLRSSWISLQRINENARPIANMADEPEPLNNEQDFGVQEDDDMPAQNIPEPPSERDMPQNPTKLKYELELEKDKRLCVICQDNIKNILLMPCRHVCMCQQCLLEIRHGHVRLAQCPLCRTNIQSTLEVFV